MALSDPFSTTYNGSLQAGLSTGQGIQQAAGAVGQSMTDIAKMKQQQQQKIQTFKMMKDLGILQQDPPTHEQLIDGLKQAGAKKGVPTNIDPATDDATLKVLYKLGGIPLPQGKMNIQPGAKYDFTTGDASIEGQKAVSPEAQAMKEMSMEMQKQRLQDAESKTKSNEWDKLDKITNPNIATNRSPLGMAGRANMSADRALTTLKQPDVTNQEAGNVMADVASIYQAGSPTEFGMSEQGYRTLYAQAQALKQYVTGQPQDAMTPEIKQRLMRVLQGMKDTNSKVIKQNLKYIESAHADLIKKDPDKWNDMKSALLQDYGDDSSNGASSVLSAAGMGGQSQQSKYTLVQ